MTRVLQKNKANITAASKQKKTRIPTKQVQCQSVVNGNTVTDLLELGGKATVRVERAKPRNGVSWIWSLMQVTL